MYHKGRFQAHVIWVILGAVVLLTVPVDAQECLPAPSGLVGWWPLDGSGEDIEGGNDGVVEGNGGQFVPAKVGEGFKSGGRSSGVMISHSSALDVTEFTIDAWVLISDIDVMNMPIATQSDSAGANLSMPYAMFVGGTNYQPGKVFVLVTDGVDENLVLSNTVLPVGSWTHVVGTADGTSTSTTPCTGEIKIYINGELDTTATQEVCPFTGSRPFQLGGLSGGENYFNGIIDEVELFERALEPFEIQAIYGAGSAGKCRDEDGDGFRPPQDCDETNAAINPDAVELPGNDVDENCDGILLDDVPPAPTNVRDE